ncbi:exonuclease domain-containing protein [Thiorhodovibrio frisius]|uniref:exonuclease domain-containing protein n=1 Tax=Thiorhodovibrio frisius TaxID=631362 RepID=UPI0002FCDF4B
MAAQRMRGWKPEGPAFRRLLNHGVEIPSEAARVNGYTPEILERDGEAPHDVYAAFTEYAGAHPLVAYNLEYDLEQVLRPEWQRLGIDPIGQAGFCALRLTQRLLDPVPAGNHKLQTLRQYCRLPQRGAHTALGDVETLVDLMQQVLRPLAEARGLATWEQIAVFASAPWFPSRIAFGRFKGRPFSEVIDDPELHAWLEWLSRSNNPRSAAMGRWYLNQLDADAEQRIDDSAVLEVRTDNATALTLFRNPELETLRQLIAGAWTRLAELEAEYTQEHHGVEVTQSELFQRLRAHYERRDALQLKIQFRRKFLDTLLIDGEEEAEAVESAYQDARAETEREYQDAAAEAAASQALSDEEQRELKTLFKKLARLYHPDRYASDPDKQQTYERLMQAANQARDRGDIEELREIANDPNGFLLRQGLSGLDFSGEAELAKLRQLYETLQARILDALQNLRESSGYELYQLSQRQPGLIEQVARQQADELDAEIAELDSQAIQLGEEIEGLTGASDPFR